MMEQRSATSPDGEEPRTEPERVVVSAYDVCAAHDLRLARDILEREPGARVLSSNPLLVQLDQRRLACVLDYGTVVFFNHSPGQCQQRMESLRPAAQRPNKLVSEDSYVLYLAPRQKKPEGTDELYVREFNRDIALLVSIVLSRSVSLEYYERLVADALAQFEKSISDMATRGWMPRRFRELTKQVGFALSVEHELAYELAVFDDPDVVWDGGKRIEQLYAEMKREFDLDNRIRIIQQKISLISRSSTFVLSRLEAHRASMLEWMIIILILSEILLVLLGGM